MVTFITRLKDLTTPAKKCNLAAFDAYTIAQWGTKMNRDTLINKCIEEINETIKCRSQRGLHSMIFEYDTQIENLGKDLLEYYYSLGYNVLILDQTVNKSIKQPVLFISWAQ